MPVAVRKSRVSEGSPNPLGATWDGLGVNFALFSAHATQVELCLFDAAGTAELQRIKLPEYTDEVWHGYLPVRAPDRLCLSCPRPLRAGERAPLQPEQAANRPLCEGARRRAPMGGGGVRLHARTGDDDRSFDARDSASFMPKCRVIDPAFTWGRDRRPRVPWDRTIFYEAHVRGFTMRHPAVPEDLRGTFSGLGRKEVVNYIRTWGSRRSNCPVHAFINDRHLLDKGLTTTGAITRSAFSRPIRATPPPPSVGGFKAMVADLHEAGIEVILDVVYNHTAEGNERGPTLWFKGIDNANYYRLLPDQPRYYINDTGTGNTLNLSHPRVLQMVTDTLRYWVTEMHVDGFRFDLARFSRASPTASTRAEASSNLPTGSHSVHVKLIAEPWDIGPGGYQVGGFPPGWAEWNDRYRDTVRDYWKGDEGKVAGPGNSPYGRRRHLQPPRPQALGERQLHHRARRLYAQRPRVIQRKAQRSERRRQPRRPLNNRSWNSGAEGPTDDPEISRFGSVRSATSSRLCCSRKERRCCLPATNSAERRTATTTRTARTATFRGWTGTSQ